jgi:SAM-dependent methyltransferase
VDWYRVAFGEIYPLVYPHRDEAEAAAVAARLKGVFAGATPLLDLACGNGRYMRALARAGVDAYGVDLSEFLLGEAHGAGGLDGRLVRCDMRALPFRDGAFGAAINMFTSFGYFDADADNARVLHEVARVLRPGGVFVLDFINEGPVRRGVPSKSTRRAGDAEIEECRELDALRLVLSKRVTVRRPGRECVEYEERVRLYDRESLAAMLTAAAMPVVSLHGDYDLGPFDPESSARVILVCRRRGEDEPC